MKSETRIPKSERSRTSKIQKNDLDSIAGISWKKIQVSIEAIRFATAQRPRSSFGFFSTRRISNCTGNWTCVEIGAWPLDNSGFLIRPNRSWSVSARIFSARCRRGRACISCAARRKEFCMSAKRGICASAWEVIASPIRNVCRAGSYGCCTKCGASNGMNARPKKPRGIARSC